MSIAPMNLAAIGAGAECPEPLPSSPQEESAPLRLNSFPLVASSLGTKRRRFAPTPRIC